MVQPIDCAVPRISLAPFARDLARDFDRIVRAMSRISSKVMLPECLMFFSFLRSRGGSVYVCVHACANIRSAFYTEIPEQRTKLTLEGLDDKRGGGRDDVDLRLTVLDRKLDGHTETLPRAGRLCDIFTDLLRRLAA